MQDLFMIRVDAYVSLRLAMKMCDSRKEHIVPRPSKKNTDQISQSQDTGVWSSPDKIVHEDGT